MKDNPAAGSIHGKAERGVSLVTIIKDKITPSFSGVPSQPLAQERVSKVQAWLKEKGIDAVLITHPADIRYVAGYYPLGTDPELAFLAITQKGASLFTAKMFAEEARKEARGVKLVTPAQTPKALSYHDALEQFLSDSLGAGKDKKIGIEKSVTSTELSDRLKEIFPSAQLVDAAPVEEIRLVKNPEEIQVMKEAVKVAEDGFRFALDHFTPGMTEQELAAQYEIYLLKHGSHPSFETIVASGPNGADPHHTVSSRPIQKGDVVVFDFGATIKGWNSDMTRTFLVGGRKHGGQSIDPEAKKVYEIVRKSNEDGIKAAVSGAKGSDVDHASRKVIEDAGYGPQFIHSTGHGIGVEVHERPWVSPSGEDTLREGVVHTVEPGIYLDGKFGVRIEDMVLITKDGPVALTTLPKDFVLTPKSKWARPILHAWASARRFVAGHSSRAA